MGHRSSMILLSRPWLLQPADRPAVTSGGEEHEVENTYSVRSNRGMSARSVPTTPPFETSNAAKQASPLPHSS